MRVWERIELYVLGRIDRFGGWVDSSTARDMRRKGVRVPDDLRERCEARRERARKWGW